MGSTTPQSNAGIRQRAGLSGSTQPRRLIIRRSSCPSQGDWLAELGRSSFIMRERPRCGRILTELLVAVLSDPDDLVLKLNRQLTAHNPDSAMVWQFVTFPKVLPVKH